MVSYIFFTVMFHVYCSPLLTIFQRLLKSLVLARVMKDVIFSSLSFLWTKKTTQQVALKRDLPPLKMFSSKRHKVGMRHLIVISLRLNLFREVLVTNNSLKQMWWLEDRNQQFFWRERLMLVKWSQLRWLLMRCSNWFNLVTCRKIRIMKSYLLKISITSCQFSTLMAQHTSRLIGLIKKRLFQKEKIQIKNLLAKRVWMSMVVLISTETLVLISVKLMTLLISKVICIELMR